MLQRDIHQGRTTQSRWIWERYELKSDNIVVRILIQLVGH